MKMGRRDFFGLVGSTVAAAVCGLWPDVKEEEVAEFDLIDKDTIRFSIPVDLVYWHCQESPARSAEARYRHVIRDVYQRIDQSIGALLDQIAADEPESETTVIIMTHFLQAGGLLNGSVLVVMTFVKTML